MSRCTGSTVSSCPEVNPPGWSVTGRASTKRLSRYPAPRKTARLRTTPTRRMRAQVRVAVAQLLAGADLGSVLRQVDAALAVRR